MLEIVKILKDKGYKVTPQRIAVYEILSNTKEHPSADIIYSKLQPLYPTMSFATVYKTLEVFKELDLVQEINVGEDKFRYDSNTKQHPHITCVKCGRVEDVDDEMFFNLTDQVQAKTGYQLVSQKLYFFGYCPMCNPKS